MGKHIGKDGLLYCGPSEAVKELRFILRREEQLLTDRRVFRSTQRRGFRHGDDDRDLKGKIAALNTAIREISKICGACPNRNLIDGDGI